MNNPKNIAVETLSKVIKNYVESWKNTESAKSFPPEFREQIINEIKIQGSNVVKQLLESKTD